MLGMYPTGHADARQMGWVRSQELQQHRATEWEATAGALTYMTYRGLLPRHTSAGRNPAKFMQLTVWADRGHRVGSVRSLCPVSRDN
jgi:hypothetical protein